MGRTANHSGGYVANSTTSRLRYLFIFATIFVGSFLMLCISNNMEIIIPFYNKAVISPREDQEYDMDIFNERFTINTEGCSIPALKPLDKQFVSYPKNIKTCRNIVGLLSSNKTHIWIKQKNKMYYNVTSYDTLICCYQSFYRPLFIIDITSNKVDNRVQYNECVFFTNAIVVTDEFVKVKCFQNGINIYQKFFLFTVKKEFSPQAVKKNNEDKLNYNILVLGIDGVSRLNFHRTMPKTLSYLNKKGAIELLGYNKVGDNTFPNLIPILLGIKESELAKTCNPKPRSTFDNCPFVWQLFKQNGFYTAFAEDSASLGTFNYQKPGFSGTPTDYYIHTFMNEAEKNAGNNKDFNSFLCMNEQYFYTILLRYVEDLSSTLKNNRLFGFFWEVTMTHDYLNYPMVMDDKYERLLSGLDSSNYLNDTILFLISDHGIRWGPIRSTKQGRLEERLPFVYILVPQSFRNEYYEAYKNLNINSRRLTTPFDLHATLYDLVDLGNIKNNKIASRKLKSYAQSRSVSLFLPIMKNRTCQMADIDDHWCTCQKTYKMSLKSKFTLEAASQLIKKLNKLVSEYDQCAHLKLAAIIEASEIEIGTAGNDEIGWREFIVVIRTTPGDGVFEATLRYDRYNWILAGTISRLNLYGDQSRCVHNYKMKLYCFCT